MARTKKVVEEVIEAVEMTELDVIEDTVAVEELVEVIAEEPVVEVAEVEEEPAPAIIEEVKAKIKKIVIETGPVAIADFPYPIGFDLTWNEDIVNRVTAAAGRKLEIIIPAECDLKKWVNHYRQFASLGAKILMFGEE